MTFRQLLSILWRRWRNGRHPGVKVITRWNPDPWRGAWLTRKRKFDEYEEIKRIKEAKRDAQRD